MTKEMSISDLFRDYWIKSAENEDRKSTNSIMQQEDLRIRNSHEVFLCKVCEEVKSHFCRSFISGFMVCDICRAEIEKRLAE